MAQNPWLNISWDNPFADGDRDYPVLRDKFKFGSVDYVNHINRKKYKILMNKQNQLAITTL